MGSEQVGATHVDEQHHGHLTFLIENLDKWGIEAGSHVPVDEADIVAVVVLAHLTESHTAPLERALVLSRKNLLGQRPRPYLNPAHFLYQFRGFHVSCKFIKFVKLKVES